MGLGLLVMRPETEQIVGFGYRVGEVLAVPLELINGTGTVKPAENGYKCRLRL
ncbi:hypothetical protein PVT67_11825 [Gallaecimonas kandeliae]|uniref:hypothetical protein n=1 Tax=Gallaecimonas kandeliae TaxID=3029055 RepID=UPI002649E4AD|nr:hypothetical protein [Gallaecimonas kandeliae]WKE64367.1 hypothetical protein PVT67_11825 [Gallaecimonas kandeliae]